MIYFIVYTITVQLEEMTEVLVEINDKSISNYVWVNSLLFSSLILLLEEFNIECEN